MKAVICGIGGALIGAYLGARLACHALTEIVYEVGGEEKLRAFSEILEEYGESD